MARFEMQLRAKDMSIMKDEERQRRRRRKIERRNAKWYDPVFEKRGSRIAKKYCGSFLFDGLFLYNFVAVRQFSPMRRTMDSQPTTR